MYGALLKAMMFKLLQLLLHPFMEREQKAATESSQNSTKVREGQSAVNLGAPQTLTSNGTLLAQNECDPCKVMLTRKRPGIPGLHLRSGYQRVNGPGVMLSAVFPGPRSTGTSCQDQEASE